MKSIIIETVRNGYIVRCYNHAEYRHCGESTDAFYVFNNVADLQKQLPELLTQNETNNTKVV